MDSIIKSGASQDETVAQLKVYLEAQFTTPDPNEIQNVVGRMVEDGLGFIVTRQLIGHFAELVEAAVNEKTSDEDKKVASYGAISLPQLQQVAVYAMEQITARQLNFENEMMMIREALAKIYQADEQWEQSAKELMKIPLEAAPLSLLEADKKFDIYVKIAQLQLQCGNAVNAEMYINRASRIAHEVKSDTLLLVFKASKVRVLDMKRKFIEAAIGYYQLSIHQAIEDEKSRDHALKQATICAVLSEAGPRRTQMLATLYKDERSAKLPTFRILQCCYKEQIISASLKEEFAQMLPEHVTAFREYNLLDRATIMNNMLAASNVYDNIMFDELGGLLGISGAEAEETAASMIAEGRMSGQIDQIDQIVRFDVRGDEQAKSRSDWQIHDACQQVNTIVQRLEVAQPAWFDAQFE